MVGQPHPKPTASTLSSQGQHAGEEWRPSTWQHAPPEAVRARASHQPLAAKRSIDIWALGSLAYATMTHSDALQSQQDAIDCAKGKQLYQWETPEAQLPPEWRDSRLAVLLAPCLDRDPAHRPGAAAVLAAVSQLVNSG